MVYLIKVDTQIQLHKFTIRTTVWTVLYGILYCSLHNPGVQKPTLFILCKKYKEKMCLKL